MSCPFIVENLEKHFGDTVVLRGISAAIEAGRITAFIGPNGAGKTTFFHAASGDIRPDGGKVLLHGKDMTAKPAWQLARAGLGKMYQDVRVFEQLSLIDNVMLALHDHPQQSVTGSLLHWRPPCSRDEAEHWLNSAGVQPPFDRPASSLSLGNKKLLALARLLAGQFDVLLLDEPTSGVSPDHVARMEALLQKLCEQGKAIALIEHNYNFVSRMAGFTYMLRDGAVHDAGVTDEVLDRKENREVLIGL